MGAAGFFASSSTAPLKPRCVFCIQRAAICYLRDENHLRCGPASPANGAGGVPTAERKRFARRRCRAADALSGGRLGEDIRQSRAVAARRRRRHPNAAVGLVEVAGRVKWFDVAKGYGFIVPDSGEADVLIHVTVLRRDGFSTLAKARASSPRRSVAIAACRCFKVSRSRRAGCAGYAAPPARAHPRAGDPSAGSRSSSSNGSTVRAASAS